MKKYLFFLMALVTLTFVACEQSQTPPDEPKPGTGGTEAIDPNTVITLSVTDFALTPGETKRINVSFNPQPASSPMLTWTSSNDAVATVKGGLVTGVANGTAVITVAIEGTEIKATANVKVGSAIDNVEFVNIEVVGYKADMIPLSVKVLDMNEDGTPKLDENGDSVWVTVTDLNEDGADDYFIAAVAYIMPKGMLFDNGVTATLNMIGGTSYPCRTLHIITTSGEMFGVMEEGKLFVRKYQKDCKIRKNKRGV